MLAPHSVTVAPLEVGEVDGLRRLARSERGFAAAARRASRLTFLSAASGRRLDPEAALGLRLSEADAIVALARTPARTGAERDWKARLIRSWRDGGGADPLLDAMIDAALAADRARVIDRAPQAGRGRERS